MMKSLLLAAMVFLTGCTLSDLADAPPQLFELKAEPQAIEGQPLVTQMLIDAPQASAGINTARIAVLQADQAITYYKNVSWTDAAPDMLQTVLVASFEGSQRLPAVARQSTVLRADYLLKSDLRQFAYAEKTGIVTIELQASLIEMPRRTILAGKGFKAEEKAENGNIQAVVAAYQKAASRVANDLVGWTVTTLPARIPAK